ncbi:TPA: hypothetical protein NV714_003223 [Escherichia coli]|nr:hypothetical protein [Escherichia coli]
MNNTKKNKGNAFALSLKEDHVDIKNKTKDIIKNATVKAAQSNGISNQLKFEEVKDISTKNRLKEKNENATIVRSVSKEEISSNREHYIAKEKNIFSQLVDNFKNNLIFIFFWAVILFLPALATVLLLLESHTVRHNFLTNDGSQIFWLLTLYISFFVGMVTIFYTVRNLSLFITTSILKK